MAVGVHQRGCEPLHFGHDDRLGILTLATRTRFSLRQPLPRTRGCRTRNEGCWPPTRSGRFQARPFAMSRVVGRWSVSTWRLEIVSFPLLTEGRCGRRSSYNATICDARHAHHKAIADCAYANHDVHGCAGLTGLLHGGKGKGWQIVFVELVNRHASFQGRLGRRARRQLTAHLLSPRMERNVVHGSTCRRRLCCQTPTCTGRDQAYLIEKHCCRRIRVCV